MSIKTLRKRIALVAVSALGFGLLSVAPALAGTAELTVSANGVKGTIGVVTAVSGATTAQVMTITSDGAVGVTTANDGTGSEAIFTVSGGTISSVSAVTDGSPNAARTSVVFGDVAVDIVVKPNAGVTSMVLSSYTSTAAYTAGTRASKVTVTVVPASSIGTFSSTYSFAKLNTTNGGSAATYTDVANANYRANGEYGYIDFSVRDGNNKVNANFVISASASNGALISFSSGLAAIGSAITTTDSDGDGTIFIAQPVANAPLTTTVTISINGAVWTSKTMTITGDVASVKIVPYTIGRYVTAANDTGTLLGYAYDSAGNQLAKTLTAVGALYDSVVSGTSAITTSKTTYGAGTFTCANRGKGKVQYYVVNDALAVVSSNTADVACAGDPYTYTASLDKASYKPGEIATLTITAKDSKGNLTNGTATLGTYGTYAVTISGAQMTAVATPTFTDTFTDADGVKTYKFTVGTTEGDYNLIVDLPKWTVQGNGAGEAVAVAYKVSSGVTGVTNAEVLAAIVKLIASINKQIKALQKSLKKR